jgi:PAS domain S-box-containing protein
VSALFAAAAGLAAAGSPIAIIDEAGRAVDVTAFGLAMVAAEDRAEFQRRLLSGEGPGARQLRRLAASLPIAGPSRLERIRSVAGSRAVSLNVRCFRIPAADGASFLILTADDAQETSGPSALAAATAPQMGPHWRRRFLWSLDRDGRFGDADPALAAALGAAAPQAAETIDIARRRIVIENADAFAAAVQTRETFSGLMLLWGADDEAHALPITFSGAPLFDSAREFVGFKGFGTIGEAIAAARPGTPLGREPAENALAPDPAAPATAVDTDTVALAIDPNREEIRNGASKAPKEFDGAEAASSAPPPETLGPPEPFAPQERTAEIYVLRQGHAAPLAPSKIVPIRPGAFDAPRPPDANDSGDGSVELSKAEREAFREIARALVGHAPASRKETLPDVPNPPVETQERALGGSDVVGKDPDAEPRRSVSDLTAVPVLRNALTLLDRLPLGVLVARDAHPLYVNQTLLALLGYHDLEHFEAADGLTAMFRGDDRPTLPAAADGAFSIFTAEGQPLAVEGRAQAIVWDGAPATLLMLRPAKTSARAERHDVEGETKAGGVANDLAEMLALAADGAVVLDSAGRIQSFNPSAERLFGYREKDVVGESVLMLLAPPSHLAASAGLDSLSRHSDGSTSEPPIAVVGRECDGAALALTLTLARVGSPDAPYYCALFRDMRREREAERRLIGARDAALAASAAKTDFLAHVSHEIRTPLHAILGFAEVMMEERFGPIGNDRYRDYLKDIHASGRHVMSLADDLLDLSKIESGKLDLDFASVDANSLIRECVSLMQPQASRERIIMRVSLFDRLPHIMVDERSLRQIMLNLMSNAVKFNEPGGQVIVSTAVDASGQPVIRVRDTGVGMNESEVGVALEPFGQVGRSRRKGGVGLGLPLTKALVEANRAEFSIKSRRDQGTLIEICFPAPQAAQ